MVCKFLKDPVFVVDRVLYCETQPPASIAMHWLSRSIFAYCRQYDVLDHTNHIFSVRIWSWQHVSVIISCIHCWVEPSLLLFCIIFIIISKAFYKSGLRVWWKLYVYHILSFINLIVSPPSGFMVATGREIILNRLTHSMIIEWLPVAGEGNTEAVDEGGSRSVKHFST